LNLVPSHLGGQEQRQVEVANGLHLAPQFRTFLLTLARIVYIVGVTAQLMKLANRLRYQQGNLILSVFGQK
jgi:hypothetical protein